MTWNKEWENNQCSEHSQAGAIAGIKPSLAFLTVFLHTWLRHASISLFRFDLAGGIPHLRRAIVLDRDCTCESSCTRRCARVAACSSSYSPLLLLSAWVDSWPMTGHAVGEPTLLKWGNTRAPVKWSLVPFLAYACWLVNQPPFGNDWLTMLVAMCFVLARLFII